MNVYAVGGMVVFCVVMTVLIKSLRTKRSETPIEPKPGTLIREAPIAIVALDRKGCVRTWNRAAERMFGWPEGEALGRATPIGGNSGVEREAHERAMGGEIVSGVEVARRRKDGRPVEIGLTVAPIRDPAGEVNGVVEWMADLTPQKQTSHELNAVSAALRRAHGIASLFDWEMDVHPEAASQCDSLQAHLSTALRPEDRRRRAATIQEVAATGRRADICYQTVRPDGGATCFRERIEALCDASGQVTRVAGTAQDVTEVAFLQAQLQQAERLAAVGRLAAGITHDFNNMIAAVGGHNALLLEKLDEHSAMREHALQIQAACERAGDLAHKLLSFSRGEAVRPAMVDLNSIVYAVAGLLQPLTARQIEWTLRLDPSAPRIKADSGQIHQAVVNLVLNASEAMPEGGALAIETSVMQVDASPDAKEGSYALLAVGDTGSGFDEETRNNILAPHFTTKQAGRPAGFGLATVRHIVAEAGGWINVQGEPGKGARIEILLPRESSD